MTRFEVTFTTSSTSSSGGFGVGVGLGFQSGGGGGMSLIVWAFAAGKDVKMASTPQRNAGHKSFPQKPVCILTFIESPIMPPACWLTCLSILPLFGRHDP